MFKKFHAILCLAWCWAFVLAVAKSNNDEVETDSRTTPSSCPAAKPRIVRPGTKLSDEARFPLTLEGDCQQVLAAPEVHVTVDGGDVVWTEGPLVRRSGGRESNEAAAVAGSSVVYFSDTIRAVIYRLSPEKVDGPRLEVWATHAGGIDPALHEHRHVAEPGSNGLATDAADPAFVVIAQHGLRRVVRCRLDDHPPGAPLSECPDLQIVADSFRGAEADNDRGYVAKKFNSPNDVAVSSRDGSVWFTDPIYGLLEKERFCDEFRCDDGGSYLDRKSELGWQGVYRVDRTAQDVKLITKLHRRPNGLTFSPDGSTLWVADSTVSTPSWTAYDMEARKAGLGDSKASFVLNPATLGTTLGHGDGLPRLTGTEGASDGFKVDERGRLWASVPNGVAVLDPVGRRAICQILLGVNTSNVAFGKDGDVWLTGKGGVWKVKRRVEYGRSCILIES